MRHSILPVDRLSLRGNCHTHSTYSDGTYPPQETVRLYREAGYDFLYLTEHSDKLTYGKFPDIDALDSDEIRVIGGVEYRNTTLRNGRPMECFIVGLGTLDISFWEPGIGQQPVVDGINAAGALPIIACARWDGSVAADVTSLTGVAGIEIFNATCEGAVSKGYAVAHWDAMLEAGIRVWGLAVDDAHLTEYWPDFALGWIVVFADQKTPDAIGAAIRRGEFYSSCGPEIHEWSLDGETITFRCSPVATITANYQTSSGRVFRDPAGGPITQATFPLDRNQPFLRMSCRDEQGRWAWTNPLWIADLPCGGPFE